jgi:hypothetical protein
VEDYLGKRAVIQIIDQFSGEWGHLNVDDIAFADAPSARGR